MVDYQIPEWLLKSQGPLPPSNSTKKARRSFAEKTIDAFSGFLMDDFYAERIAGTNGLMQGLHPGIKVVTTLLLIFVAVSLRSWELLLLLNLLDPDAGLYVGRAAVHLLEAGLAGGADIYRYHHPADDLQRWSVPETHCWCCFTSAASTTSGRGCCRAS